MQMLMAGGAQAKQDTTELQNKSKDMKARIIAAEENAKAAEAARDKALGPVGNLVHESVPVSNDEVCLPSLPPSFSLSLSLSLTLSLTETYPHTLTHI